MKYFEYNGLCHYLMKSESFYQSSLYRCFKATIAMLEVESDHQCWFFRECNGRL